LGETVKIECRENVWYLLGDITEACNLRSAHVPPGKQIFDLSGVRIFNSSGIRLWCETLAADGIIPIYKNCPPTVVSLFNMIPEFLGSGGTISSFQVPIYCPSCSCHQVITLEQGRDFTPGKPFIFQQKITCTSKNCAPEPDVDDDAYFHFLASLPENT
jgi:hypothetical protein